MHAKSLSSTVVLTLALHLACSDGTDTRAATDASLAGMAPVGGAGDGSMMQAGADSAGAAGADSAGAAGSGNVPGGDDRLFVPEDLPVTNLSAASESITVTAVTLTVEGEGPRLLAALKNEGKESACDAAVSFELFDQAELSLGAWIAGLYSSQVFRRSDGVGGLVACIDPGETAMVALLSMPTSLRVEEVASAVYQITYFDRAILPFELEPVDALALSDLQATSVAGGQALRGTFENRLDVVVKEPAVTIFPVNSVGRPLGVATSSSMAEVPPGGSWAFETTPVADIGVDYIGYARGSVSF